MKQLLITHIADGDGIGCAILLKLVDKNCDILYYENHEINPAMNEMMDDNYFDKYDRVLVTDISFDMETALRIDKDKKLKEKIVVFDHHESRLELDKFSWANIVVRNEKGLTSGISLLHEYLLRNYKNRILRSKGVKLFVESTRQGDTWEWKTVYNNQEASDFGSLFKIYGKAAFFNIYLKRLKRPFFKLLNNFEKKVIVLENKKMDNYINIAEKNMLVRKVEGYNVGIVFADSYKSHLGNFLAEKYIGKVDFIAIIDLSKSISYRSVKDEANVAVFAKEHGGGGHARASGSPISEEIKDKVLELLFKEVK